MDPLAAHAQRLPDALAVIDGERTLTWRAFVDRRNRLAGALRGLGVAADEHVVVYTQNSLEAVLAPAAVRAAGAIAVPMNHRLVADEVLYILDHADAATVFVSDAFLPVARVRERAAKIRHWITVGAERRPWALHLDDLVASGDPAPIDADPARGLGGSMIYTGGTTGRPRGALRGGTDPAVTRRFVEAFGLAAPGHVHLVAGPLYHSAPGSFALFALVFGGTVVVMRKFDPEDALRTIARHRCTSTFMAPTLVKRIVDLPEAARAL